MDDFRKIANEETSPVYK